MVIDLLHKWLQTGGGSGSGSTVSWTQSLSAGTQIASITIDGSTQNVYAPEGGSVVVDSGMSETSENAVQNKAIKSYIDEQGEVISAAINQLNTNKQNVLTAGSGISISGDTISVSGISGGECNYQIVPDITAITTPYEGLMAYASAHTETFTWSGYTITPNEGASGNFLNIKLNGTTIRHAIYSGGYWYHDWKNQNEETTYLENVGGVNIIYRTQINNPITICVEPNENITFEWENLDKCTTAITSLSYVKIIPEKFQRYHNGQWENVPSDKYHIVNGNTTQSEWQSIYNILNASSITSEDRYSHHLVYDYMVFDFYDFHDNKFIFEFKGVDTSYRGIGYYMEYSDLFQLIEITSGGTATVYKNQLTDTIPIGAELSGYSATTLYYVQGFTRLGKMVMYNKVKLVLCGGNDWNSTDIKFNTTLFTSVDLKAKGYYDSSTSSWQPMSENKLTLYADFYIDDKHIDFEALLEGATLTLTKWDITNA